MKVLEVVKVEKKNNQKVIKETEAEIAELQAKTVQLLAKLNEEKKEDSMLELKIKEESEQINDLAEKLVKS